MKLGNAFLSWFGKSKVVDSAGKPSVMFHGTNVEFYVFGEGRGAIYFTDNRDAAQAYAEHAIADLDQEDDTPRVIEAFLRIENPLEISRAWAISELTGDDGGIDWMAFDEVAYQAQQDGHDGIILRGVPDFVGKVGGQRIEREYDQYVVFRPEQIKSATNNCGAFDPNNPDIRG